MPGVLSWPSAAMPIPSSVTLSSISSPDPSDGKRDQPDTVGECVLDRVGAQFIDQQAEWHGALGIDLQGFCLDGNSNAGRASQQARRQGLGDFREIGLQVDGAVTTGLRHQVIELGDGHDAVLHGPIALHPRLGRPSDLGGDQGGDDLRGYS